MIYTLIAAISENRALGKEGKIPWYIPEDWKHFKETTHGHPIIMGRKTYESIGKPLPGRENIIITRGEYNAPGTTILHSISECTTYLQEKSDETKAFICGGGEIYRAYLESGLVDEIILSRVKMVVDGADTFFPAFESDFRLDRVDHREQFDIEYWIKK